MSKYGNEKTEVDGIVFDSKLEAARYGDLKLLLRAREIENLRLQVPFKFEHNGITICTYVADFVYLENGVEVVEDSKGKRTREYSIKRKLMLAFYGIKIRETDNGKSHRHYRRSTNRKDYARLASRRGARNRTREAHR